MTNEQKQKTYICHDFNTLECLRNFLQINKQIWIATVNYQRIARNFKFFEISQIVTGKMPTKANLKCQVRLRENKGKFAYRTCKF
jgi:hypothetical protein